MSFAICENKASKPIKRKNSFICVHECIEKIKRNAYVVVA